MKLVESDIPHDEEDTTSPRPPRPPRRRVAVSLLLTLTLLGATVGIIYVVFPKRDNEILTVAIASHMEASSNYDLNKPTDGELRAWTVGVLGKGVPWPRLEPAALIGARAMKLFRRPVAYVRLRIGDTEVSLLALRARDAPPRKRQKRKGALWARSWRRGKWTMIAVGDVSTKDQWAARVNLR